MCLKIDDVTLLKELVLQVLDAIIYLALGGLKCILGKCLRFIESYTKFFTEVLFCMILLGSSSESFKVEEVLPGISTSARSSSM